MRAKSAVPAVVAAALLLWAMAGPAPARAAETAQPLTLNDYFAAALRRSEVVATQSELIRQAEERYRQATSALFPTVNGVASYTWQEPLPSPTPSTSTAFLSNQPLAKLAATQPLFRGFREYAALRQTRALIGAQNEDYLNARVQLFRDVAQNFFGVLTIEQDLRNLDEEINQNLKREADLRDRIRIGRSRVSELLNVQTTISTLRAQVEQQQGQLRATREAFAFLSGLDAWTPLTDDTLLPNELEPLDDYLKLRDSRPDVRAAQRRVAAAQENVLVAKGAHLPSIDLNGNYYFDRPGALKDVNWDVSIALTVPIYAGGSIESKVREAQSQQTQAELSASQVTRQADQEIRSLYEGVVFDRTQQDALEKATDAARKSFEAQTREYRLGLVTNLDVLQALTAFQENQRALDRARFTTKFDYLRLQAATTRRAGLQPDAAP